MACKATTKLPTIIENHKEKVERINDDLTDGGLENYTEKEARRDLTNTYAQTSLAVVKLYAPAVLVSSASLASIIWSHRILSKRNLALASAYTAIDRSYKEYRKRVKERFGEEVDKELKYGIKKEEVTTIDENGKETTETVGFVDPEGVQYSDYARFFDETNVNWQRDAEYNLFFLKQQESVANDMLRTHGFLYLNEVYDMLGFRKTRAGQEVGWVCDEKLGKDCYVDFGIYDIHKRRAQDFVNGYEKSILLDFNVDGIITYKMEELLEKRA